MKRIGGSHNWDEIAKQVRDHLGKYKIILVEFHPFLNFPYWDVYGTDLPVAEVEPHLKGEESSYADHSQANG